MNLTPNALAFLSAIVLAAAKRIEAIRTYGADSIEASIASIEYSNACIKMNRDTDITEEEWNAVYPTRRMIEEAFAHEAAQSYASRK